MMFATLYRTVTVLAAITAATAVTHLLSVLGGAALGSALPTDATSVVAGITFLVFAGWTIRGDELIDSDAVGTSIGSTLGMVAADALAIVVAECEARMDWEPMMAIAPLAPSERSTLWATRMLW